MWPHDVDDDDDDFSGMKNFQGWDAISAFPGDGGQTLVQPDEIVNLP